MEKELKLKTSWQSQTTHIQFGVDFALSTELAKLCEDATSRIALVTDSHLEKLYQSQIEHLDLKIFSFPAGEENKTRETKEMLEDHLLSHNFGRDCMIVALGGGVVGDVAGFLASTYCRGVPYIQIPTSLLAMVDSSVGGKTGLNTPYGKNMVGTFYPPKEVWIDGVFLKTLPEEQWGNGLVEMIKAGLIASPSLFESLKTSTGRIQSRDLEFILERIYESVAIKREIVEHDPEEEKGMRRMLNLGHTFGHALEVMENYKLPHGRAVAMGILASSFASNSLGHLNQATLEEIKAIFTQYGIKLSYEHEHTLDEWMSVLARDKKSLRGSPRIVMLDAIGSVLSFGGEYCDELEFPLLEKTLNWTHENFYRPS